MRIARIIWQIAAEITDKATRAREGKLTPNEMRGGTISITNIGSAGGMFFTPVINYPEVAILGTGRISEKPVVRNGEIVIGKVMALSLSFDHRIDRRSNSAVCSELHQAAAGRSGAASHGGVTDGRRRYLSMKSMC